jgi:hypothetical protein
MVRGAGLGVNPHFVGTYEVKICNPTVKGAVEG